MAKVAEADHVVSASSDIPDGLGPSDIQQISVCKLRFSALPVLTYPQYAPLRFSQIAIFASIQAERPYSSNW